MDFEEMEREIESFRGGETISTMEDLDFTPCHGVKELFSIARIANLFKGARVKLAQIYPCYAFSPHFVLKIFDELIYCGLNPKGDSHGE